MLFLIKSFPSCIIDIILLHVHSLQLCSQRDILLKKYVSWENLYCKKTNLVSEEFIEFFIDDYTKHVWFFLSYRQKLSEAFIEKYKHKMNWETISEYQTLSEAFIEKHKDEVDWDYMSMNQTLSEAFIEKYKDEVDWEEISKYQTLSDAFIDKHKDKVVWKEILKHQKK